MAEEDLIFGKNRHMFGGIEPSNMLEFTVTPLNGKVRITAKLPNDTVINNQTLCTVAGAVIRRKETGYPTDEFDGTLVADITSSRTIIDTTAVINNTYYYAAFPYTTQGVYNKNPKNRFLYNFTNDHYIYGYDLDMSDSNSATRVSYPADCNNAEYAPAYMDFTSGTFNYGGWSVISTPGKGFMPKPCMLKYDGTILHYLWPDDYAYKCTYNDDGEPVKGSSSAVATPGSGANAMVEWPKIYTHRELVDGVYKFRCSDVKISDDWDCWCNYDKNNNEIPHFYTSIYTGVKDINSSYNDRLRSISGYSSEPGYLITDIYNYGKIYSSGDWRIDTLADYLLIQDLLVLMAKDTDGQSKYGSGYMWNSYSSKYYKKNPLTNGTTNAKGMFWGKNEDYAVKVFGMENRWGNFARILAGLLVQDGTYRAKLTIGTHDGSTCKDYADSNGNTFTNYEKYIYIGNMSSGYISDMNVYSFGRLPSAGNGSSTTYECDACNTNTIKGNTGEGIIGNVAFGFQYRKSSEWYHHVLGPFHMDSYVVNTDVSFITSGLSCKPSA